MPDLVADLSDSRGLVRDMTALELRHLELNPDALRPWRASYGELMADHRTAEPWQTWLSAAVERDVAGWFLSTLFVCFSEANGLVPPTREREPSPTWWLRRLGEVATALASPADMLAQPSFGQMSPETARLLTSYWTGSKAIDRIGALATQNQDTRFLGDLYQDLSEQARMSYSLLQTPEFVGDLIVEQALGPVLADRQPDDLRILDPVCGSGTFLLGAFVRLIESWNRMAPEMPQSERVERALGALHGIDIYPPAVLITRFRLLIAAHNAARGFPPAAPRTVNVAVADSLLAESIPAGFQLGSFDVVIGNPPYVTVKDKTLARRYREEFDVATGRFALTVPFVRRFFDFASRGDRGWSGQVGIFVSNSFIKREFGRKLATEYLVDSVRLTRIIDTSGAYIPGHGTPTVILIGSNRQPQSGDFVQAVVSLRGEPALPTNPANGKVWRSIVRNSAEPNRVDKWTESVRIERDELREFPWKLSSEQSVLIMHKMSSDMKLSNLASRASYLATTGADDIFVAPRSYWVRQPVEIDRVVTFISGSQVRDWSIDASQAAFCPRGDDLRVLDTDEIPGHHRRLWRYRTLLEARRDFSGEDYRTSGKRWYDWHSMSAAPRNSMPRIVFSGIASHPHFATLHNAVTSASAPMIELNQHAAPLAPDLLAILNSSAVCFWLKQVSPRKGISSVHAGVGGGGESWEEIYNYTPIRLRELPLPVHISTSHGSEILRLVAELTATSPRGIIRSKGLDTEALRIARTRWTAIRERMITLVEEQDWEIYRRYELIDDELTCPVVDVPHLKTGERSFEIALARKEAAGEAKTGWFTRHGSWPITEIPAHWSKEYRRIVEARIAAIEADPTISILERPEHKRRWATETWERREVEAVQDWLANRCEAQELWYDQIAGQWKPRIRTLAWLITALSVDPAVTAAVNILAPNEGLAVALHRLLEEQHVPCVAAARYTRQGMEKWIRWKKTWHRQREEDSGSLDRNAAEGQTRSVPPKYIPPDFRRSSFWRLRGKADVPQERFISYPSLAQSDPIFLLGWAGWSTDERIAALASFISEQFSEEDSSSYPSIGVLAALLETIDRSDEPSDAVGSEPIGVEVLGGWLDRLQLTEENLRAWQPTPPRRGRPPKTSVRKG